MPSIGGCTTPAPAQGSGLPRAAGRRGLSAHTVLQMGTTRIAFLGFLLCIALLGVSMKGYYSTAMSCPNLSD